MSTMGRCGLTARKLSRRTIKCMTRCGAIGSLGHKSAAMRTESIELEMAHLKSSIVIVRAASITSNRAILSRQMLFSKRRWLGSTSVIEDKHSTKTRASRRKLQHRRSFNRCTRRNRSFDGLR